MFTARERCNAIEECYEYMLAYAGKGVRGDEAGGGQLRFLLGRAIEAFDGLADAYLAEIKQLGLEPAEHYEVYLNVLRRDAEDSLAAFRMVLSLASISSQVIDNLNALIHVRAMLTDLFLIDEILRPQRMSAVLP
jgi:hypothetical protein